MQSPELQARREKHAHQHMQSVHVLPFRALLQQKGRCSLSSINDRAIRAQSARGAPAQRAPRPRGSSRLALAVAVTASALFVSLLAGQRAPTTSAASSRPIVPMHQVTDGSPTPNIYCGGIAAGC